VRPSLVIVGLGNPGASYAETRHNAGFRALDALREAFGEGEFKDTKKLHANIAETRVVAASVLLVKPQTYMNRSGESVRSIVDFYKLDPSASLLVISDDTDLPLGEIRMRAEGGPGTHNGLKSIVEAVGEGFPRIRIGLGACPPGQDLSNWVLSVPPEAERDALAEALRKIPGMVREFVMK